jgi:RNA ligase (TIGR02306 family)
MSEFFPQIVKIEKVEKHPYADNLSIAYVLGDYPIIIRTGQFNAGDLACYIQIDAVLPDVERWYNLTPKAYEKYEENGEVKQRQCGYKYPVGSVPENKRVVRAKKIRGIYSQGILAEAIQGMNVGDSIVEVLNLKKFEFEEEDNIPNFKLRGRNAESPPKGWSIPYYDLESIRKHIHVVDREQDVVITEKLHGASSSYCHDGNKLWCKSRNFFKKFDEDDSWVEASIRYDLENKLAKYPMLAFFAELVGQVKRFRYDTEVLDGKLHTKLYFFDIYNTQTQRYLNYDEFVSIIKDIGLETTPLIYRGPWTTKSEMYSLAERNTALGGKHIAEGWVLSLAEDRYDPQIKGRVKLKYISEQFNLTK